MKPFAHSGEPVLEEIEGEVRDGAFVVSSWPEANVEGPILNDLVERMRSQAHEGRRADDVARKLLEEWRDDFLVHRTAYGIEFDAGEQREFVDFWLDGHGLRDSASVSAESGVGEHEVIAALHRVARETDVFDAVCSSAASA